MPLLTDVLLQCNKNAAHRPTSGTGTIEVPVKEMVEEEQQKKQWHGNHTIIMQHCLQYWVHVMLRGSRFDTGIDFDLRSLG